MNYYDSRDVIWRYVTSKYTMVLSNLVGHRLPYDVTGVVPLSERKLSVNFLLACKSYVQSYFCNKLWKGMNINIVLICLKLM